LTSRRPDVERPYQPVGIAPLRLAWTTKVSPPIVS
jgi:hypothetical protein